MSLIDRHGNPLSVLAAFGGDRDMTLGEVVATGRALLGRRASLFRTPPEKGNRCMVAAFTDDAWDQSPIERAHVILGDGASFHEAFRRAKLSLLQGKAAGLNLSEEVPPKHDRPLDGQGPCAYGCCR